MGLSSGQYVVYADSVTEHILYGKVDRIEDGTAILTLRYGQGFLRAKYKGNEGRFQTIPNRLVDEVGAVINSSNMESLHKALEMALETSAAVTSMAAPGLFGGAAMMNGLATIGFGSTVFGIVVVSAAPSGLLGKVLVDIVKRRENDTVNRHMAIAGAGVGGVLGCVAVVEAVAAGGAVSGLSGAGITSGLAWLGGGTIASGAGFGMAGGLVVCSGIIATPVALGCLLYWGGSKLLRGEAIEREYAAFLGRWGHRGYEGPI